MMVGENMLVVWNVRLCRHRAWAYIKKYSPSHVTDTVYHVTERTLVHLSDFLGPVL